MPTPVIIVNTSWFHSEKHMRWLQEAHGVPADMTCAILTGHEDKPTKIEAWRGKGALEAMATYRRSPRKIGPPDFVKDF